MALLLEGQVDNRDDIIAGLQEEVRDLERDLAVARADAARAKRDAQMALGNLRRQLSPLYQALQAVFGELDAAGIGDAPTAGGVDPRWASWKQRMPGRPAEVIDLLLVNKSMSVKNLMAALHCGKDAVYQVMSKMGQAGIVSNSGGRYSLKGI